jgi:hypothetical protein
MVTPITRSRFKECFTAIQGPVGSLWDRIQRRILETQWYEDVARKRVGVIIYDVVDGDWQAIVLRDFGLGYTTHEVRVSLPTEQEAVETLMDLFCCETQETAELTERINRLSLSNTGRTGAEMLLATSETD